MNTLTLIAWTVLVFLLGVWVSVPVFRGKMQEMIRREEAVERREKKCEQIIERLEAVVDDALHRTDEWEAYHRWCVEHADEIGHLDPLQQAEAFARDNKRQTST